jgi:phosphatidylglycerophosphate synthase
MPSTTSPAALVVLLPGADFTLLGLSVRVRNARVAVRHGALVCESAALAERGDHPAMIVPPSVAIDSPLFPLEPSDGGPVWLEPGGPAFDAGGPRPAVLAGTAAALSRYVLDPGAAADLPRRTVAPGALMDVAAAGARRRAAWKILRGAGKTTDGWFSRTLNRPVSRLVSYAMLSMGLSAGHASFLTLVVGIAAAAVAAQPGHAALAAAGVLLQLSSMLDGVDGEMARATLTESAAGARLDTVVDHVTYVASFLGIVAGWVREGGGVEVLWWGGGVAIALILTLLRAGAFVSRHAPSASFVFIDRAVRRAARDSRRLTLRAVAAVFTLLRRDAGTVILLAVTLTGQRVLLAVLVAAALLAANLTLSIYRRELAVAAAAEGAA